MPDETRAKRWKIVITLATFLALGVLIYAVRAQIMETLRNFGEINSVVLLFVLATQALSYDSYARMYRHLFGILGHEIPYKRMLKINIELNFVNSVFPSGGVSGFSYFGLRMKSEGISTGQSTLVQLMRFILIFISFQALLFGGLFVLALGGQASNLVILIAGSLATLLLVGTIGLTFVLGSKRRINAFFTYITRFVNRVIHVVRKDTPETISIARVERTFTELHENYLILKQDPRFLKWPLVHALFANLAEIMTIYVVYMAFGQFVNPGAVIIAYAIANFAGLVSVLPGGVGIYEGLMTAVLATAGVPAGVSIPVTIMYRITNMTLQLPVGYYFYHRAVQSGLATRPKAS